MAVLGLAMGSFINALVWRIHEQAKRNSKRGRDLSILTGRSMCPHCGHELAVLDLIPLISWIALRGRCRYCNKPISIQYPLIEFSAAVIFVTSYIWWPGNLSDAGQITLFVTWLWCAVGLLALLVYDLKWMLLPSKILYPVLAVAAIGRLLYIIRFTDDKPHELLLWLFSLVIASGLFWLLYEFSKGKWIGFGDVRLGLVIGTLLASPSLSFLMIFLASVLGLLAYLLGGFGPKKSLTQKIPFGPFLITATWLVTLFGQSLIDWYARLFTTS